MIFTLITLLSSLGFVVGLKVVLPASGNTWDLSQLNSYNVFWDSVHADPSHVHVALHDSAGNVVENFERVEASSGTYLISGLYNVPSGSDYQIVLSDVTKPKRKILARSGKFSIRQDGGGSSSDFLDDPATAQASASSVTFAAAPTPTTQETSDSSSGPTTALGGIARTSTTQTASTQVTHTSAQSTSSSPFPQYQRPNQGLSTGAKAGIGVGIAVVLLFIIGAAVFVWRKRRRIGNLHHDDDDSTDVVTDNGKPELAGSQPTKSSPNTTSIVEKSELDNSAAWTGTSVSRHSGPNTHPTISDMPPQSNRQPDATHLVEIGQHTDPSAEMSTHGKIELNAESSHQQTYPIFAELPVTVSRNSSRMSPSTRPDVTTSQDLPTRTLSASDMSQPSPSQRAVSDIGASSSRSYNNGHNSNNDSHERNDNINNADEDISALRQRERELAESICAAENLARLKSEQRAVQEKIRRVEEDERAARTRG